MGLETWGECDRCGTCVREPAGRAEVLCRDCRAALGEAHATADEVIAFTDTALLREGK